MISSVELESTGCTVYSLQIKTIFIILPRNSIGRKASRSVQGKGYPTYGDFGRVDVRDGQSDAVPRERYRYLGAVGKHTFNEFNGSRISSKTQNQ